MDNLPCCGCCFIDTTTGGQDYCIVYNRLTGALVPHKYLAEYMAEMIENDTLPAEIWQRIIVATKTIANGNIGPGARFEDGIMEG